MLLGISSHSSCSSSIFPSSSSLFHILLVILVVLVTLFSIGKNKKEPLLPLFYFHFILHFYLILLLLTPSSAIVSSSSSLSKKSFRVDGLSPSPIAEGFGDMSSLSSTLSFVMSSTVFGSRKVDGGGQILGQPRSSTFLVCIRPYDWLGRGIGVNVKVPFCPHLSSMILGIALLGQKSPERVLGMLIRDLEALGGASQRSGIR